MSSVSLFCPLLLSAAGVFFVHSNRDELHKIVKMNFIKLVLHMAVCVN